MECLGRASQQNCRRQSALNFSPPLINPPHFPSSVLAFPACCLTVARLQIMCVCVCGFRTNTFSVREMAAVVGSPPKAVNACTTHTHPQLGPLCVMTYLVDVELQLLIYFISEKSIIFWT